MQPPPSSRVIVIDVGDLTDVDEVALDALVRLQLTASRSGASIRLRNARAELVDLLALVGLSEIFAAEENSGLEPQGLLEEREQIRIDEVIDPGDATV